jgi:hypothetical protein
MSSLHRNGEERESSLLSKEGLRSHMYVIEQITPHYIIYESQNIKHRLGTISSID